MQKDIIQFGNPLLRKASSKVNKFDEELKVLVTDMLETMRERNGIGLSAVQIGVLKKVVVAEYNPENEEEEEKVPLTILINPKITNFSENEVSMEEGCLSLPGVELAVKRPEKITILAQNQVGERIKLRASGLLARVLQHEIDHLNGVLFTDHVKGRFKIGTEPVPVVFFGTPDFSVPSLEMLHKSPIYRVEAVVTEPDKPAGRGQKVQYSAVKKYALENNIPVLQPERLRAKKDGTGKEIADEFESKMRELSPQVCIVASYGKIIPKTILDIPPYGFVNIHPSLLPLYRGPCPMHTPLLNGDQITGVTIMKMDEGMDTGPLLSQAEIDLDQKMKYSALSEELSHIGASMLLITLPKYLMDQIQPMDQDEEAATYTQLLKKEDGQVDLVKDRPEEILGKVRAFEIWPGTYFNHNGNVIKIKEAHIEGSKLVLDRIQPEGKKEMTLEDYNRGHKEQIII